jgi:transcriptional regulator with XRE-family HTH domain
MTKRYIVPLREGLVGGVRGGPVWSTVGQRLRRRRIDLGLSADRVAQLAGISVETYEGFEEGLPISASLLAQFADLLDIPVVWFFHGIAHEEPAEHEPSPDADAVSYRVATVEHRLQALADTFRQLDFEGQQHLLAISQALSRSNAAAARD